MIRYWLQLAVLLLLFIGVTQEGHSLNRFFEIRPGFRIVGMAIDINSRVPDNGTTTRFDFGGGLNFDIQLEKILGLDLELMYLRKGSDVGGKGARITLHYLSIPTLIKFWLDRNKFALAIGPVHNFLLGANGKLDFPNVELNSSNTRFYDVGIAFGMTYIMHNFSNGTRLVGDLRSEFGLLNVYKGSYRPEIYNRVTLSLAIGLNF